MKAPLTRILLRYVAMFLIAKGWFSSEDGNLIAEDPDLAMLIEMGVGFVIAAGTEVWFAIVEWWNKRKPDDEPDYGGAL